MVKAVREITADEEGIRLDRWFRRHFPNLPQAEIQKMCRQGHIRIDGVRSAASHRLAEGDKVSFPSSVEENAGIPRGQASDPLMEKKLRDMILYEDEDLMALNKPSGLATQGGTGIAEHVDLYLESLGKFGAERPRLVHRIDRDTSGILLVAKRPGVAAKLAAAFKSRKVEKIYWALVSGRPEIPEGELDQPVVKVGIGAASMMAPADRKDEGALNAKTSYQTLDRAGDKFTWLELTPLTGRTHQLRVHCESLGVPILGDPKYGGEEAHRDGFEDRLHLHARRLKIPHPAGGTLSMEAPLPRHMRESFRRLGFVAPAPAKPLREKG